MAIRTKSKSSLFLIEMIIVILVFAFASAICVSLFVQARIASRDSTRLTMAIGRCQNAVETLKAVGDDPAALEEILGAVSQGEGRFLVGYDAQGRGVPLADARYVLELSVLREGDDLLHASVTMTETGDEGAEAIYTLKTTQFHP